MTTKAEMLSYTRCGKPGIDAEEEYNRHCRLAYPKLIAMLKRYHTELSSFKTDGLKGLGLDKLTDDGFRLLTELGEGGYG